MISEEQKIDCVESFTQFESSETFGMVILEDGEVYEVNPAFECIGDWALDLVGQNFLELIGNSVSKVEDIEIKMYNI